MSALAARLLNGRDTLAEPTKIALAAIPASLLAGAVISDSAYVRYAFTICGILLLAGIGLRTPRTLLYVFVIWLTALGMTRRLLSGVSPGGTADPLLLLGPACLAILTVAAGERGAFNRLTRLALAVLAYTLLTLWGAVNPLQGSMTAGVTALIFFVPLLAFWVGRGFLDRALLRRVLQVIAGLAIVAAAYGLYQTHVGLPSWDERWVDSVSFASLNVEGALRPFAMFSSSAEFGTFLAVAVAIWLALGPRGPLRPLTWAAVGFLGAAIVYQASRGTIVMVLAAMVVMTAARRRLPLFAAVIVGAMLLMLVPPVVGAIAPEAFGTDPSSRLLEHQVEGLSNPLDPEASTASIHFDLLVDGLKSAFTEPLGHGIGAVTIAGSKFGGVTKGTEADPSNAAVALGLPGLVAFVILFALAFAKAYGVSARRGDHVSIAALGVLTVMSLQWLNGGQYAVAYLPWLVLGFFDRDGVFEEEA